MRILVTGGNGFIGKEIIEFLGDKHKIVYPTSKDLDLTNQSKVDLFFRNKYFDWVIHCAVKGGRRISNDEPEVFTSNMLMFINILRNSSNFKYLINFSSGAEYDRSKCFLKDKVSIESSFPLDYYGLSKNLISRIINRNPQVVNMRLFGVFGVNEDDHRYIKTIYKKIKSNEEIVIFNDIYFDFFFIDDLLNVVNHYIDNFNENSPKDLDLVYQKKFQLSEILELVALKIKEDYDVNIINETGNSYTGSYSNYLSKIKLVGLDGGIDTTLDLLNKL